jgi:hypothetical protein
MNNPACWQIKSLGNTRLAGRATMQLATRRGEPGPGGMVNGTIDTPTT